MVIFEYLWQVIKQSLQILAIGFLPYLIFAFLMQKISNSIRNRLVSLLGIRGYIYITAPGVMIHELSHAFFCILFRHKIVEMKLFSPEEDGTLGYVNHRYNPGNRFHRVGNFFIGTGPVWGGVLMLWLTTSIILPSGILHYNQGILDSFFNFLGYIFSASFWTRWQSYLWLYLILTISSHITLSPPDLAGAKEGAMTLIATVFLFELLLGWSKSLNASIENVLNQSLASVASILGVFLILTFFFAIILSILIKKQR